MTDRTDAQRLALEQRLERMSRARPPSSFRRRVLSAVDDMLYGTPHETVPGTKSGWSGGSPSLRSPDLVPGTVFVLAIATAIAVVALSASAISTSPVPLTLDDRVRLTCVGDHVLATLTANARTTDLVLRPRRMDDIPAHRDTLRVLDAHRLLQETL